MLAELVRELREKDTEAVAVIADVGVETDVETIARTVVEHFGGFDTWVNNAGVSVFGYAIDVR